MKKAIGATLFHCSDINDPVGRQHQYKPSVNPSPAIKNLPWSSDPNQKTTVRDLMSRCIITHKPE